MNYFCIAGCGRVAVHEHHIIFRQELLKVAKSRTRDAHERAELYAKLIADRRNMVPVCFECHGAHHNRGRKLQFRMLPNTLFAFARETLGAGPAYEYLIRRHDGDDARVSALLQEWEADAA